MFRVRNLLLTLIVLTAACFSAIGQEKKAAPAKAAAGAVLHPEMSPEGTYIQPMGKLGEKPPQPWSSTTVEAAVKGKPNPGKEQTVTGEIVDFSCYLQLGKHGKPHIDCGQKCLRNGQPIGLLAKDGSLYMLMEEEHHPRRDGQTNFRDAATSHMGHIMEVTGTVAHVGGYRALYVSGFKK